MNLITFLHAPYDKDNVGLNFTFLSIKSNEMEDWVLETGFSNNSKFEDDRINAVTSYEQPNKISLYINEFLEISLEFGVSIKNRKRRTVIFNENVNVLVHFNSIKSQFDIRKFKNSLK